MGKAKDYVIEYEEESYYIGGIICGILGVILLVILLENIDILKPLANLNDSYLLILYALAWLLDIWLLYVAIHEYNKFSRDYDGEVTIAKEYIHTKKIISIKEIINPETQKRKPIKYKEVYRGK